MARTTEKPKDKKLQVLVDEQTLAKLEERAQAFREKMKLPRLPFSEYIRRLIELGLEREDG